MNQALQEADTIFMREALVEAKVAFEEREVPIGAIITKNNHIIARGHNRRRALKDITSHAEMMCLRDLSTHIDTFQLGDYTIYSTLEPCAMCSGAIIHYGIGRVVYGAKDLKLGASGSSWNFLEQAGISVTSGILDEECRDILYSFFERELGKPSKIWEDIELE